MVFLISWLVATKILFSSDDSLVKTFVTDPTSEIAHVDITFTFSRANDDHVVGEFDAVNTSSLPTTIVGVHTREGTFWPQVLLEVTNNSKPPWQWRTVAESSAPGTPGKLKLNPTTSANKIVGETLLVDMDAFKPFINVATYGRIVFRDGNWSMFDLKRIAPLHELKGNIKPQG